MSAGDQDTFDREAKGLYLGERCSRRIMGRTRTSLQGTLSVSFDLRLDIPLLDERLPLWFWANIVVWQHEVVQGDCWSWKRPLDSAGYGRVIRCIPNVHAHRIAWEAVVGPVPNGMVLDHLCLNRSCVRPIHLNLVLPGENAPSWLGDDREAENSTRLRSLVCETWRAGNCEAGCGPESPVAREAQGELFRDRAPARGSRKSQKDSVEFGDPRLPKRFWRSVSLPEGPDQCWEWYGSKTRMGYGRILWAGDPWMAHRVSYGVLVGPIPEGHDVHHRCKNTGCVRPDHLMAVTRREHLQLDANPIMQKCEQTHCVRGHAFTCENTSVRPRGGRVCRRCAADRAREVRAQNPEATRERDRVYMRDYRRRKAEAADNGKLSAEKAEMRPFD